MGQIIHAFDSLLHHKASREESFFGCGGGGEWGGAGAAAEAAGIQRLGSSRFLRNSLSSKSQEAPGGRGMSGGGGGISFARGSQGLGRSLSYAPRTPSLNMKPQGKQAWADIQVPMVPISRDK